MKEDDTQNAFQIFFVKHKLFQKWTFESITNLDTPMPKFGTRTQCFSFDTWKQHQNCIFWYVETGTIETLRLQKWLPITTLEEIILKITTKVTTSITPLSPPKWKSSYVKLKMWKKTKRMKKLETKNINWKKRNINYQFCLLNKQFSPH